MRECDKQEVKANSNKTPKDTMLNGYTLSERPMTVTVNGIPAAMYGVVRVDNNAGYIWMLGTDEVTKANFSFLKACRGFVGSKMFPADVFKSYKMLFTYMDSRNTVHINWAKWLGFSIINKHPEYGYEKRLFYEFVRII
jgi:hypothetical protein